MGKQTKFDSYSISTFLGCLDWERSYWQLLAQLLLRTKKLLVLPKIQNEYQLSFNNTVVGSSFLHTETLPRERKLGMFPKRRRFTRPHTNTAGAVISHGYKGLQVWLRGVQGHSFHESSLSPDRFFNEVADFESPTHLQVTPVNSPAHHLLELGLITGLWPMLYLRIVMFAHISPGEVI